MSIKLRTNTRFGQSIRFVAAFLLLAVLAFFAPAHANAQFDPNNPASPALLYQYLNNAMNSGSSNSSGSSYVPTDGDPAVHFDVGVLIIISILCGAISIPATIQIIYRKFRHLPLEHEDDDVPPVAQLGLFAISWSVFGIPCLCHLIYLHFNK